MKRILALQKIVQLGSFSQAAAALHCTQSAISQMIASLENEWGMKILLRSRTGVKLTPAGSQLYKRVTDFVYSYERLQSKAAEVKGVIKGTIRIGTISSITTHWLPKILKNFSVLYPDVKFIMHQGDYTSILEWIKRSEVDFGFINPDAAYGVETIPLRQGKFMAILPKKHILANYDNISLKKLATCPFILLEEGHFYEPLEEFKKISVMPEIAYTLHDDYAIMAMVEAGLGVSILPELVLKRTPYNIEIKATNPPIMRTIALAFNNYDSLSLATQKFITNIKDNLKDPGEFTDRTVPE